MMIAEDDDQTTDNHCLGAIEEVLRSDKPEIIIR